MRTNVTGKAEYQKRREAWEDKFLRLFAPSLIGKVPNLRAWDSMAFFDFEWRRGGWIMVFNAAAAKEFGKTLDDLKTILTLGLLSASKATSRINGAEVEIPGFVRREFHV